MAVRLSLFSLEREVQGTIAALQRLLPDLPELVRRSGLSAAPDGYGQSGVGRGAKGGVARPTEAQGLALAQGQAKADVQQGAIEGVAADLHRIYALAKLVDERRDFVMNIGDGRRSDPAPQTCLACGREVRGKSDRLRSGYCGYRKGHQWSGCYSRWVEQGRPDRSAFERWVREQRD